MLGLTKEERQVVLFLAGAALLGAGGDFLLKRFACVRSAISSCAELGKVDLNTANIRQLMDIPGIGEKLAGRIIEYRDKQAGLSSLEGLRTIKGISREKYEKIRQFISVK